MSAWIAAPFLLAGSLALVIGAIGLHRLPEFFSRSHAASLTDVGACLILVGLLPLAGPGLIAVKLVLVLIFLVFTSPTATHALAQAARADGIEPPTEPATVRRDGRTA